jgi:hypothetical protein
LSPDINFPGSSCLLQARLGVPGVATLDIRNQCTGFLYGLQTVPASRAALIVALNPAVTFVGAALLFGERPSRAQAAGVALALAGAAVVIGHGNPLAPFGGGVAAGDLVVFGCVLSWSTHTLIGKRIPVGMSPGGDRHASLTGTVLLALVAWWLPAPMSSIAPPRRRSAPARPSPRRLRHGDRLVWFYDGVRALGPARAVFINLVPSPRAARLRAAERKPEWSMSRAACWSSAASG